MSEMSAAIEANPACKFDISQRSMRHTEILEEALKQKAELHRQGLFGPFQIVCSYDMGYALREDYCGSFLTLLDVLKRIDDVEAVLPNCDLPRKTIKLFHVGPR